MNCEEPWSPQAAVIHKSTLSVQIVFFKSSVWCRKMFLKSTVIQKSQQLMCLQTDKPSGCFCIFARFPPEQQRTKTVFALLCISYGGLDVCKIYRICQIQSCSTVGVWGPLTDWPILDIFCSPRKKKHLRLSHHPLQHRKAQFNQFHYSHPHLYYLINSQKRVLTGTYICVCVCFDIYLPIFYPTKLIWILKATEQPLHKWSSCVRIISSAGSFSWWLEWIQRS